MIQTTGQLPDPDDLSHVVAHFRRAREMRELLEEIRVDYHIIPAIPSEISRHRA